MKRLSYSVAIRTLGKTGEKYNCLLQSIAKQSIQPEEIIVAIPNGYELDYKLGNERVVRCPKGMTHQRSASISAVKSDYVLVVDDDIEFGPTMIEDLYDYLLKNNLDCSLPMEGYMGNQNETTINLYYPFFTRVRGAFTGQLFTSYKKSPYLDVLTYTAGHKIYVNSNNLDTCYLCNTACFQCFFIKTKIAQSAHFEEECWLDEGTLYSYASFDDPVFFSKINKGGFRMAYALRVRYKHLDAKAGHAARTRLEDKRIRYYTMARNRSIYWYRCIYKQSKSFKERALSLLGGFYGFFNYSLFTIVINLHPKYWEALQALYLGYRDAYLFIRKR